MCSSDLGNLPLFTALFNYRHSTTRHRIPGATEVDFRDENNYPLTVSVTDTGEALSITVAAVAPADPELVWTMLNTCLENLVTALEDAPDTPLSQVQVLEAAERDQVLREWNETAVPGPAGMVPELVAGQAGRIPDAVAVSGEGEWVSYGHLLERAGRLAGFLRDLGAGPESVVGLCLERGPLMITAVLGTWLAGAAYLPLDPAWPAGRLAFALADSGAVLLVGAGESLGELPDRKSVV